MTWFPSIPPWDGIHPAMVHFPIALLFAAPVLLLISLIARQTWRTWLVSALVLMTVGTVAAWFAAGSGHAAGQLVLKTPDLERAIAQHEALGVTTRNVFTILTLVLGVLVLMPSAIKKPLPAPLRIGLHAVFLVVYIACTSILANTANRGGHLVHELGVRAMVEGPKQQAAALPDDPARPEQNGGTESR